METIITYLLEKGGAFGVLLAIAIAWIVYREQFFFKNSKKEKEDESDDKSSEFLDSSKIEKILYIVEDLKIKKDTSSAKSDIDKMLYILDDLKNSQEDSSLQIKEISLILGQAFATEKEIDKKIHDLWEWHGVFDAEVKKSLEESIKEDTISSLQQKLNKIHESLRGDVMTKLQKINDERIVELKELLTTYNKTITDLIVALENLKTLIKAGAKTNDK